MYFLTVNYCALTITYNYLEMYRLTLQRFIVSFSLVDVLSAKDENLRRMLNEMENLAEDVAILNQINDLIMSLHCPHGQLEEVIREMLSSVNKQLIERQTSDSQLSYLELTLSTQ